MTGAIRLAWACGCCIGLVLGARPGAAELVACPVEDGHALCEILDGDVQLEVDATSLDGGSATASMRTGGGLDLPFEAFELYSFADAEFIDAELDSAAADVVSRTIRVQFTEASIGSITTIGLFTVTDQGDTSVLEESITVQSNVSAPVAGRLYVVTDFDLNGDAVDDAISASAGGARIEQGDAGTVATVEVTGEPPDGFDVAPCCALQGIATSDVFTDLAGHTSVAGPDDFQSALSWDRQIGAGQSVTFTLRKTLTLPEPGAGALGAAAGLALRALSARRRRA